MRLWLRFLIVVPFSLLVGFALLMIVSGDIKAALGALVVAGIIAPLLVDVFWPGKYVLRKPDGEVADNLFNRVKQFRIDHPGRDGTFFLGVFALIVLGMLMGGLVRIFRLFNIG